MVKNVFQGLKASGVGGQAGGGAGGGAAGGGGGGDSAAGGGGQGNAGKDAAGNKPQSALLKTNLGSNIGEMRFLVPYVNFETRRLIGIQIIDSF